MKLGSWLDIWRRRRRVAQVSVESDPGAASSGSEPSPISSDRPIQHPDEDLFGVDPFAQMVARSISGQRSSEGTVIYLETSRLDIAGK